MYAEACLSAVVRPVQRGQERLKESAKLGFTQIILPWVNAPRQDIPGMQILAVARVKKA